MSDQLVERIRQGNAEAVGTGVSAVHPHPDVRASPQQTGLSKPGKNTFHGDTNRNSYLTGLPFCQVLLSMILDGSQRVWLSRGKLLALGRRFSKSGEGGAHGPSHVSCITSLGSWRRCIGAVHSLESPSNRETGKLEACARSSDDDDEL